jgi:hypothetical protein
MLDGLSAASNWPRVVLCRVAALLTLLTALAGLTVTPAWLRAQQTPPEAPNVQTPAPQPEHSVIPKKGVRLALPRALMPPDYQVEEDQTAGSESVQGQSPSARAAAATAPAQTVLQPSQTGATGKPSLMVEYASGKLSVTASQVPLSQVLREIGQKTGLEIDGLAEAGQVNAIQFSDLPVSEAVQDLLAGTNYILSGKLSDPARTRQARIVILGAMTGLGTESEKPSVQ